MVEEGNTQGEESGHLGDDCYRQSIVLTGVNRGMRSQPLNVMMVVHTGIDILYAYICHDDTIWSNNCIIVTWKFAVKGHEEVAKYGATRCCNEGFKSP